MDIEKGRRLYVAQIIHTKEDMGTIGQSVRIDKRYTELATGLWDKTTGLVWEAFFSEKARKSGRKLDKAYQDGLPNISNREISKLVSKIKSPNYQLLRSLKSKVTIIGPENQALLQEEYELMKGILDAGNEEAKQKATNAYAERKDSLLEERDNYIARVIGKTLRFGETGILFIGIAHKVHEKLPKDIDVLDIEELRHLL